MPKFDLDTPEGRDAAVTAQEFWDVCTESWPAVEAVVAWLVAVRQALGDAKRKGASPAAEMLAMVREVQK